MCSLKLWWTWEITYSSGQRHTAGEEISRLGIASGHHAELVAGHEAREVIDLLIQRHLGVEVGLLVGISRLVAGISVGETLAGHIVVVVVVGLLGLGSLDVGCSIRLYEREVVLGLLDQ